MYLAPTSHTYPRGVVLLEAVVAIGILGLLVSGVLALSSRSVQAMYMASDEVIASYLALDASEWIRARTIYNQANGLDWLLGIKQIGTNCTVSAPCGVSTIHNFANGHSKFSLCSSLDDCVLEFSGTGYTHAGGAATYFRRTISFKTFDLDGVPADDEQVVYTITVFWRGSGNVEHSKTMYTTLYREIK
ncbi:MAG: hypothetical protein KBD21_05755 [Candidatus Pacebacteria bacterium]|nr:hypothetical protein [Candidatus Paceibacterota bacterium]